MLYTKKNIIYLLLIILLNLLPLFNFFQNGLPVTHDGKDHVARIANFYLNLTEGNIIPRWAGNLNWGYGHPILMFLYPLPSYFASFIHFFGFSLTESTKLVFVITHIASGLFMYLWVKELINEESGLMASFLYTFAPYRFVDLFVRGAIGEHVAFMFPPLIFYSLLMLEKNKSSKALILASFSVAGLILSHNAIAIMFIPLILLYMIYLLIKTEVKFMLMLHFLALLVIGFGLSAFFWVPAFIEGKYTLRDIVTSSDYAGRFVNIKDFISTQWSFGGSNYLSKQIGLIHWVVIIYGVVLCLLNYKKTKKNYVLLCSAVTAFFISLFLMTAYSRVFWDNFTLIQKFQFPWRFLTVSVFLSAVIGGIVINNLPKKYLVPSVLMTIFLLIAVNKNYWRVNGFLVKPDTYYKSIYEGTTDTGESAPIWSVRFMEKRPGSFMEVIDGEAHIRNLNRTTTSHSYKINVISKSRLRENTLYFPGWVVAVNNYEIPVEFQDPDNRGLMTFYLDRGSYEIKVNFEDTKLRKSANYISFISLFILIVLHPLVMHKKFRNKSGFKL